MPRFFGPLVTCWLHTSMQLCLPGATSASGLSIQLDSNESYQTEEPVEVSPEEGDFERPTLSIGILNAEFRFDGTLTSPAWKDAPAIENLVVVEPDEGSQPADRTRVQVLANRDFLVVGARCYDEASSVVSYSQARDSELEEEDHIVVVLDTFMDGRSGYVFAVNASGARFDGLVTAQGGDVNSNWNTIWEARTARHDDGWSVEIRIPIKSLSFAKDLSTWGFNIQRRIQRVQETSRWAGASQDFEIYQTSRAGLLQGLPNFDLGVGLSLRPAVVGSVGQPESDGNVDWDGDLSLDVTQRFGPNLSATLTFNTDFAETEVDVRQTSLSRFELFFPETRSFFLEGADIFQFGLGLDEDTLLPFFTRRIGLFGTGEDDLEPVPINAGGKINGRLGDSNIGALLVNTRSSTFLVEESVPGNEDSSAVVERNLGDATMGAIRLRQNVLEESSVGILASFGDQQGSNGSWSAGADFTFQTSNFLDEKNLLVGVWGLLNGRDDLTGDKSAFGARIDFPNDLLDTNITTIRIGDSFDPSLGFVPRRDVQIWDIGIEFNPRPAWKQVRQTFYEVSLTAFVDPDHSRWQSYAGALVPLEWLLESGESFGLAINLEGDRPEEAFEIASDVDIAANSYEWTQYVLSARSARKRNISGEATAAFGSFYNGRLTTFTASLSIRPSAFFTLELSGERNSGKVGALPEDFEELSSFALEEREFTEQVLGMRLLFNFSPEFQFSSFTQYDNESRELGSNNRLRWTFDTVGELYVVYNHNLLRNDKDEWKFVSNQLPIKLQYAFRY